MAAKALPSPEVLRQLLRYEPETGKLFWRERAPAWFAATGRGGAPGAAARWNTLFSDREAFTADDGKGYRVGSVLGVKMFSHRAIWAMQTGAWPSGLIDHANGDQSDNRWSNLRPADYSKNGMNRRSAASSSSRYLGVSVVLPGRKWRAVIAIGGKQVHLGYFPDEAQAARAYDAAAISSRGVFARPNFLPSAAALADTTDERALRTGDLVIRQRDAACRG